MNYRTLLIALFSVITLTGCINQDKCDVDGFQNFANGLEKSKIESVIQLSNEFKKRSKISTESCKERMFLSFRSFYYDSQEEYEKASKISDIPYPLNSSDESNLNNKLSAAGWELRMSEGTYYLGEMPSWLYLNFQNLLPATWDKYFSQRKAEIEEGFSEDAMLLISWENLRSRIIFWEKFINQNPDFPLIKEVGRYFQIYIRTYLKGLSNSTIADHDSGNTLKDEVKKSYENYIKENVDSKLHTVVKEYYEIMKKEDFLVSFESEEYLKKKNFKSMFSIQPPTY